MVKVLRFKLKLIPMCLNQDEKVVLHYKSFLRFELFSAVAAVAQPNKSTPFVLQESKNDALKVEFRFWVGTLFS